MITGLSNAGVQLWFTYANYKFKHNILNNKSQQNKAEIHRALNITFKAIFFTNYEILMALVRHLKNVFCFCPASDYFYVLLQILFIFPSGWYRTSLLPICHAGLSVAITGFDTTQTYLFKMVLKNCNTCFIENSFCHWDLNCRPAEK